MPVHGTTNRRRVLSLAGGAILAGLGGCLGEDPPESMPESNAAPESATETGVDGTTPEFEPGTEIDRDLIPRAEFDCATMGDPMVRDDATDRPFVFTFDRSHGWLRDVRDTPSTYDVVLNAPVEVETGGFLYSVTVSQFFEAVDERLIETGWEEDDPHAEEGTLSFAGETRRIFEVNSGDPGRTVLTVLVPRAQEGDTEYYRITVDCFTLAFDDPDCFDPFRDLGLAIISGLRPKE